MKPNFPNRSDIPTGRFSTQKKTDVAAVNPGALNPPPPPKKLPKVYYRSELDPKAPRWTLTFGTKRVVGGTGSGSGKRLGWCRCLDI